MLNYTKLFELLKLMNIKPGKLVQDSIITPGTLKRLKNNDIVNLSTLDRISMYLGCEIWDLFTYERL